MAGANQKLFMGIDFGTSKCVMSWYDYSINRARIIRNNNDNKQDEIPSVVYLGKTSAEDLIGTLAERKLEHASPAEQKRFVLSVKRYLRGDRDVVIKTLDDKIIYSVEVVAKILRKLKKDAEKTHFNNFSNQPVSSVVITYPASFDQFQRAKIERAAKMAGFTEVELLPEPVAAAMAYSTYYEQLGARLGSYVLVYDFGGGTFDVAVVARNSGDFILASPPRGLIDCGGDDLDRELYRYCDEIAHQKYQRGISLTNDLDFTFLHACRKLKENLSGENVSYETFSNYLPSPGGVAVLFEHPIKRTIFEDLIKKHIDRTVNLTQDVLRDATARNCKVDTVVLIGGSSRIPLVLRSISDTLPAQPIQLKEWDQRDFAVALGAAYHAQKLWGKQPFSPLRPDLPPPPPGEELYRGIVIRTWMPTRRLTRTQAAELANEASKLGIDITAAAVVERGVMGYTKEEVLQQQHYAALARYRTAVNKVWQKKNLSQSQVIALDAEMKALELDRDEVAIIEREVMGDTKEAIASRPTPPKPEPPPSPGKPENTSVVQVSKWRFTVGKFFALLLLLLSLFFTLGAITGNVPGLLVVTIPLALLSFRGFLRKPRVKQTTLQTPPVQQQKG